MAAKQFDPGREFLDSARDALKKKYLPKAVACLNALSEQDIWWRPNEASNSAGNLTLHLCGNLRQWIISGIAGAPDVRHRDREFSECGPLPRKGLIALLRATVEEACGVLARTPSDSLGKHFSRQGIEMTRLRAIADVVQHFYCHTGQIIYITKLRNERDLRLTHLPKPKKAKRSRIQLKPKRAPSPTKAASKA